MKSKDLQNIVHAKYQDGDTPTKIFYNFSDAIGLRTITWWYQIIRQTGTVSPSVHRVVPV